MIIQAYGRNEMKVDWEQVLNRLRAHPPRIHNILPPCSEDRIEAVQRELGKLPDILIDMLKHFNGAELFIRGGPYVSIFGISTVPPLPPLEWAPDWYIDKFTPGWRSSWNEQSVWVIAVMSYGGVIVLEPDGTIKEWDSSERKWGPGKPSLGDWVEAVMSEGDVVMTE
jgi:SMI1 / KNR4 family (SUKH-1)